MNVNGKTNLWIETVDKLAAQEYKEEEVVWVGSEDGKFAITWSAFKEIANKEYDNSFGGCEVAVDLVIVGEGFWLGRAEDDGKEWWELKTPSRVTHVPERKKKAKSFTVVIGAYWPTLASLN